MSDDLQQRRYLEDERFDAIENDPDRRMTRAEWEREESLARQAAHKKHNQVQHDREVQQEFERKHRTQHRNLKKILLWLGIGLVILLLIFLLGWLPRHRTAKKAAAEARQRELDEPMVDVIQAKRSQSPGQLTLPGTTSALTEAFIYARANGYLKKRLVDIGDHVHKGQLLAIIDAPDLDQQVDQAREQMRQAEAQVTQQEAQLALAKVTWERWSALVKKGVFSRQDGDQKEADYVAQMAVFASAKRNVESYKANLQRMIALQRFEYVPSPFDGVITQRNTDIGALVQASGAAAAPMLSPQTMNGGSLDRAASNTSGVSGNAPDNASPTTGGAQGGALFAVAQVSTLRILVSVPEGYAKDILVGMPAQVYVQAKIGKPVFGTVTRTTAAVDQNTRTMLTEVDISNRNRDLLPGMYSIITFTQVRGIAPITIPGDAVVVRNDHTTVAIVRDNKAHLVPVEIGRDYGPSVEITSGLQERDWVITTVTDGVREGAPVRPQQTQSAAENNGGKSGAQSNQVPNAGPNQYGDQSIVNQKTTSTTNKGKPGESNKGPKQQSSQQTQPKGQTEDKGSKQ